MATMYNIVKEMIYCNNEGAARIERQLMLKRRPHHKIKIIKLYRTQEIIS